MKTPGFSQAKSGLHVPTAYCSPLYATPRTTNQTHLYRPRSPFLSIGDIKRQVNDFDRFELVGYSRQFFAQFGNLSAAIIQKNHRAVGEAWRAQYGGDNEKWGDEVEEWLENVYYPTCDVRGEPYDFTTDLFLSGISWDVDGEDLMILTENEDTHFPMVQYLTTNRIGQVTLTTTVKGGPYSGATIRNGLITDRKGALIAVNVIDDDGKEIQISARDCQLCYDPRWQSQNHGFPAPSTSILDALDLQDIDTFLKRGVKKAASVGLLHETEDGQADTGQDFVSGGAVCNSSIKKEIIEGGEDYYFKAGKGEKLTAFAFDNPSANTEAFINRLERRMILSAGWFFELLDPSKIGGASVRLIQDEARDSVKHRQKFLYKRAKRKIIHAVAKGMKHGFVSRNDSDWWKWEFEMPAQITVDAGYDAQSDLRALAFGIMTEEQYHAKNGTSAKVVNKLKDKELARRIVRAQEMANKTNTPFDWVYQQMWNPSANPQLILAEPETKETAPEKGETQ